MRFHQAIMIGLTAASVAACKQEPASNTEVERSLMVRGSHDDVVRFVGLQHSLRPPLETSPITESSDGRASAAVTIPAGHTNDDVLHTTREALAAGLSYEFQDNRSTATTAK